MKRLKKCTPLKIALILIALVVIGIATYFIIRGSPSVNIGDIVNFGGYEWRVLDTQGRRALIIMENVWENRPYDRSGNSVTWETSSLRRELNDEFYNSIPLEDRRKIRRARVPNLVNPHFGTPEGWRRNITRDYAFILSLEEIIKYFGDSGQLGIRDVGVWLIDDQYNDARIAYNANGETSLWWLRSPGRNSWDAARIHVGGAINFHGVNVGLSDTGVRPALWVNP